MRRGMTRWRSHLLAVAATAVLYALAFPYPGWSSLAYLALVPAGVMAARSRRWGVLLLCAWLGFMGFWLARIGWVQPVATWGGYLALAGLMAAWQAGALGMMWVLVRQWRLAAVLALPAAWVTMELGRINIPAGGFGWFVLGHSQGPWQVGMAAGRIVQIADVLGELGVSFFIAMTSGLIVDLLTRPWMKQVAGQRRWRKTLRAGLALWITSAVGLWIYGGHRIAQTPDVTTTGPTVAAVQTDVMLRHDTSRTREDEAKEWKTLQKLTVEAAGDASQPALIIWPETMVPGPVNREARELARGGSAGVYGSRLYHDQIAHLAQRLNVALLVGASSIDALAPVTFPDGKEGYLPSKRANSVHLYQANGTQWDTRYDKMHLVPFGEYVPWVSHWPTLKAQFIDWFSPWGVDYTVTPGRDPVVFEVVIAKRNAAFRVATPVCYEDVAPAVVRDMVYSPDGLKRVELLANMTNSGWYPVGSQRVQQLQIATLRTIENRVPMIRSVNSGTSAYIDSTGRITQTRTHDQGASWLASPVQVDSRSAVYGRLGSWPAVMLAGLTCVAVLGGVIRRGTLRRTGD